MFGNRTAPATRAYRRWDEDLQRDVLAEARRLMQTDPQMWDNLGKLLRTAQLVLPESLQRKINSPYETNYQWFRDGVAKLRTQIVPPRPGPPPAPAPEPAPKSPPGSNGVSPRAPEAPTPPPKPIPPESLRAIEPSAVMEGKTLWGQPLVLPPPPEVEEPAAPLKTELHLPPPRPVVLPVPPTAGESDPTYRRELEDLARQVGKVGDWADSMSRKVTRKLATLQIGLETLKTSTKPAAELDHTLFLDTARSLAGSLEEQQTYMVRLGDTVVRVLNELKGEAKRQQQISDRLLSTVANVASSLRGLERRLLSGGGQSLLPDSGLLPPEETAALKRREKPRMLVLGVDSGHWKSHIKETASSLCRTLEFQLVGGEIKATFAKDFDRVIVTKKVPLYWVTAAKQLDGLKGKLVVIEGAADSIAQGVKKTAETWTEEFKKG